MVSRDPKELMEANVNDDYNAGFVGDKDGTAYDRRDMDRVGKVQELRVRRPHGHV